MVTLPAKKLFMPKKAFTTAFMLSGVLALQGCMSEPVPSETPDTPNVDTPSSVSVTSSVPNTVASSLAGSSSVVVSSSSSSMASSSTPAAVPPASSSVAPPKAPAAKTTAIPGRIQAQDYTAGNDDEKRDGDTTGPCAGGMVDMRATDDNNGSCKIGWTLAGEWVDYAITSNSDGKFDIILRLASKDLGQKVVVSIDGVDVGDVTGPGKGFTTFQDRYIRDVAINTGEHTLRVYFEGQGVDLNYVEIVDHTPVATPEVTPEVTPPKEDTPKNPPTNNGGAIKAIPGVNAPGDLLKTKKFTHPGILSTSGELDFIKQKIKAKAQPWYGAFKELEKIKPLDRKIKARKLVKNKPDEKGSHSDNRKAMDEFTYDGSSIYTATLLWYFTDDDRYRKYAVDGLNAWSIYEDGGMPLYLTWAVPHFINAAEILKHTPGSQWKAADIKKFSDMVNKRWWPKTNQPPSKQGTNHGTTANEAQFAIAIFLDDFTKFEKAMKDYDWQMVRYVWLNQKGRLDGESNETCRDISHTRLGMQGLMYAAEAAWNQGVDLWKRDLVRWTKFAELHSGFMDGHKAVPKNICAHKGASRAGVVYCKGSVPTSTPSGRPPCGQTSWDMMIEQIGTRLNQDIPYTRAMAEDRLQGQLTHRNVKWETLLKSQVPERY